MKSIVLLTSLLPLSMLSGAIWIQNTPGGNWSTPADWNVAPPNAVNAVADISSTLVLTGACTVTLDISPTVGSLTLTNPNNAFSYTLTPSGANTLTMSVSTTPATLTVPVANTAAHTIGVPLILSSNLSLTQDSAQNLTISGVMSGAGSVTKAGAGIVILSGANTFNGGLTISAGVVQCGVAGVLPPAGSVSMTGGTLNLTGFAQTIGGLSGTSGVSLGAATLTVNTTGSSSYGGSIVGGGGLTVGGTGSLTLTAANGYTGLTTISSGTLQLGINNAIVTTNDVTLTGGTLDLQSFNQAVGNLSATAGNITLGSGTLSTTLTGDQTFSAVISGTGPVNLNAGTRTWTVGASQLYSGLTTIDNGTLKLGVANALPVGGSVALTASGILDLNNLSQTLGALTGPGQVLLGGSSGLLTMAPTSPTVLSGVISGAGGVIMQGPSSWTIGAVQTYTGGTTVNGGVLHLGIAGALAPTGAVVVNPLGSLVLDGGFAQTIASLAGGGTVDLGTSALTINTSGAATPTTFSGSMGGSGSLVVQGTGTQILTGVSSYSGGTTVSGTATLQGNTLSLQGTIVNNSTLFFNQALNGTYSGPLSGTGQLLVGGGGTVTLTGTPAQGSVVVQGGELDITAGSTLTATTVTVNNGGAIGGEGTLTANISNAGTINPGSAVTQGTLTVHGNVTFQPGSSYIVNLTPTNSDHFIVNGVVTINPGSQLIVDAQRGDYEEFTNYPIITATAPVVGAFDSVQQTNPFLEVAVFYNRLLPGSVEIDLEIRSLSEVIKGGNAGAISKCITQANMRSDEDLEQLIADIIFFPVEQVRKILDGMQPSQLRALTVAEQTNSLFAQQVLNWRMAQFDKSTCEKEIASCFPWNFWTSFGGNWTDQRNADHNKGYEAPTGGVTLGFDGKVAENVYLGFAMGYDYTALHWKEQTGSGAIQHVSLGPYLSCVGRLGYMNASVQGSFAHFNATRHIPFFHRKASSSHIGGSALAHLDVGVVAHPAPQVSLTPFAMVDFLCGWEGGFQEHGAGALNFSMASSSSRMFRSEVGLKISKCAIRSHTKWVHDFKASWVREGRLHGKELTASFRQFPCSFTVEGLFPSRNFMDLGMGLSFLFKHDKLAATLRYEGQFGEGVSIQSGTLQILSRF